MMDLATCGLNPNSSFIKKNSTCRLKTYQLGLETGSRIFGTMISVKKNVGNLLQNNFKMALNNFSCLDIRPFSV
jgi:hypothetical protein